MNSRIPVLFLVLVFSFNAVFAEEKWSTTSSEAKQLTELNTRLTNAYESENVALLRELLTEDHVHNNVFGVALDKNTFLTDIEKGILEFEFYRTPELRWYIDGNTAIATGIIEASAIRDGKAVPAKRFLFTRTFVKRNGAWKVLLFHNTMAKAVKD